MENTAKIAWVMDGVPLCGGVKIPFLYCREFQKLGINSCIYANGRNSDLENHYDVQVLPIKELENFTENDVIIAVWWKQIPELEKYKGRKIQFIQGSDLVGYSEADQTQCLAIRQRDWEIVSVSHYAGEWIGKPYNVIPNPVDDIFFKKLNLERDIDALIEGADEPNKNIAEAIIKAKLAGHKKIVWFTPRIASRPKSEGVEIVVNPTQEEIVRLYQRSKHFYKYSISEGFCLPLAEAMVSGCECHYGFMGGNDFTGLDFRVETSVNKFLKFLVAEATISD